MENRPHGLIDNWLRHIRDIYRRRIEELTLIDDEERRIDRLCELNVLEQVTNVGNMTAVRRRGTRGNRSPSTVGSIASRTAFSRTWAFASPLPEELKNLEDE